MITKEQAVQLKNGQHIQVKVEGKWIDALFIKLQFSYVYSNKVYAHFMGFDRYTNEQSSIYGTNNYFELDEIRLPMGEK